MAIFADDTGPIASLLHRQPCAFTNREVEKGIEMTKMATGTPTMVGIDNSLNNPPAPLQAIADTCTASGASNRAPMKAELVTRVADLEEQVAAANEKVVNLEQALESNRRIGAAIGVVMALQHVTEPEAFNVLRQASQNRNCKLRILADEVLLTGEVRARRRSRV